MSNNVPAMSKNDFIAVNRIERFYAPIGLKLTAHGRSVARVCKGDIDRFLDVRRMDKKASGTEYTKPRRAPKVRTPDSKDATGYFHGSAGRPFQTPAMYVLKERLERLQVHAG